MANRHQFYSLLANLTNHDSTILLKRQLAESGDPRSCYPTFNVRTAPPSMRTKRRYHFIAFHQSSDSCTYPQIESKLPDLLSTLDGHVIKSYSKLIHSHVISFPQDLPLCELYHLPCVKYIEEDFLMSTYQVPTTKPSSRSSPSSSNAPLSSTGTPFTNGSTTFPVPALVDPLKVSSYTTSHLPLARQSDWPASMNLWGLDLLDGVQNKHLTAEYSGKTAHVYVLDSGVEFGRESFGGRATIDFTADNIKSNPEAASKRDCTSHGTHVAGIIGSSIVGIARESKIHMLRVIGCGEEATNQGVLDALESIAATIQRPAVLSMSLGPKPDASGRYPRSQQLIDALNTFTQRLHIPIVMAAGNDGRPDCSPLASEVQNIVVVGALSKYTSPYFDTSKRLQRADFSNYGDCVTVYAPGTDIWSLANDESKFSVKRGSSQAAPYVAGIVAMLFDKYGGKQLLPSQVKQMIIDHSTMQVEEVRNGPPKLFAHIPLEEASIEAAWKFETANSEYAAIKFRTMFALIGGITLAVLLTCGLFWYARRRNNKNKSRSLAAINNGTITKDNKLNPPLPPVSPITTPNSSPYNQPRYFHYPTNKLKNSRGQRTPLMPTHGRSNSPRRHQPSGSPVMSPDLSPRMLERSGPPPFPGYSVNPNGNGSSRSPLTRTRYPDYSRRGGGSGSNRHHHQHHSPNNSPNQSPYSPTSPRHLMPPSSRRGDTNNASNREYYEPNFPSRYDHHRYDDVTYNHDNDTLRDDGYYRRRY